MPRQATSVEMELRDEMQKIAVEWPTWLSEDNPRVAASGLGGESQASIADDARGQLAVRPTACVRVTADSRDHLPVYPNLTRGWKPSAINQLWVADITYIRLRTEFVYLAVVLDAFSRRVIGWALGRRLDAELAVSALQMALCWRESHPTAWYITPIAACSTLRPTTPNC